MISLIMIKYLIIGTIILNCVAIFDTTKIKKSKILKECKNEYKRKVILLLKKLWEKVFITTAIGMALLFICIMIKSSSNNIAVKTFSIIATIYILTSNIFIVYNYNNFKSEYAKVLAEILK